MPEGKKFAGDCIGLFLSRMRTNVDTAVLARVVGRPTGFQAMFDRPSEIHCTAISVHEAAFRSRPSIPPRIHAFNGKPDVTDPGEIVSRGLHGRVGLWNLLVNLWKIMIYPQIERSQHSFVGFVYKTLGGLGYKTFV